jgi:CRP-like cAMP-binding protein
MLHCSAVESGRPFLDKLDREARDLLLSVARPVSFAAGTRILRYGQAAQGAYVLRSGRAQALVDLLGGERLVVNEIGAGAVLGEMALIERGTVSATVIASEPVEGWYLARDDFRALAVQHTPPALAVQHAVTEALCAKIEHLTAQLLAAPAAEDRAAVPLPEGDPLAGVPRVARASFEFRPFLPLLALFEGFEAQDIDRVVARAAVLELPRGQALYLAGAPADACYAVVRGAVEVWARQGERERRLVLHGPGNLAGFVRLLGGGPHGAAAFVRERALLLEFTRPAFDELYFRSGAVSARLRRALHGRSLALMVHTNTQLTRLISLARLRGARGEGDRLQAAHAGQVVAAGPSREDAG